MKLKIKIASLLLLTICACTSQREQNSEMGIDSLAVADTVKTVATIDTLENYNGFDALGSFMAGLPQRDSNSFTSLESEPSWQSFKISMDSNWNRMYEVRLSKMKSWQLETFGSNFKDSLRIFYPFSGPDFLHVYYLFPSSKEYILAALEPIHAAPQLDTLDDASRGRFLDSLGHSLRDILTKSYFITSAMKKDIKNINGVLPPLFFFIERTGHELITEEFFYLDSTGTEVPTKIGQLHWYKTPGVKLIFRDRITKETKVLYYFNISLSNQGLSERPEFEKFLKQRGPYNTFIKSASYLLHRELFTEAKKLVLQNSVSLFQDDTGVPYRDFKKRLDWNVQLYGEYVMPVKPFGIGQFQSDLDSAYHSSPTLQYLPFSLGYHWGTKKQNYMLLKKSSTSPSR